MEQVISPAMVSELCLQFAYFWKAGHQGESSSEMGDYFPDEEDANEI